jgi:hypothetical protein
MPLWDWSAIGLWGNTFAHTVSAPSIRIDFSLSDLTRTRRSWLLEFARVLVRFDQFVRIIINANHSINAFREFPISSPGEFPTQHSWEDGFSGLIFLERDEKQCETANGIALKSYGSFTAGSAKLH